MLLIINPMSLFDFNSKSDIKDWRVVNDGVMGGLSRGQFKINTDGHGFFSGTVSLENNGGFSSVRYAFDTLDVSAYSEIQIRLKGDGKPYQFRVKADADQRFSHIAAIETTEDWQTVTISLNSMYAAFRGRVLDFPNYQGQKLSEIAFLIGNKKHEDFALEIDYIKLQ